NIRPYLDSSIELLTNNQTIHSPWFVDSLTNAINWLKQNNSYLCVYSRMIPSNLNTTNPFPLAVHIPDEEDVPSFQHGLAGVSKSFIIYLLLNHLQKNNHNYLLMASTSFHIFAFHDPNFSNFLRQIRIIIIDEISMVSGPMLTYISELFESLHKNNHPFGGINVIVVGNLAQLSPVCGYKLFNFLQKIRMGIIDNNVWQTLLQKENKTTTTSQINTNLNTTHIIGYRKTAYQINEIICSIIPTNLSTAVRIQPGARVIFLNNTQHKDHIANSTMGIVTDIDLDLEPIH
ncbi:36997_t:CDS:2, partial [Racocetra persica]